MKRFVTTALAAAALSISGSPLIAQHTILLTPDGDNLTLDVGGGLIAVGEAAEDEVYSVNPVAGLYTARPFLTRAAQWAYTGDADNDGRYVDDSDAAPGDAIDAILVRNGTTGNVRPRNVFISKETGSDGFIATIEDGDVFRYAGPGNAVEVFITEAQLLDAIGQTPTSDVDLNAIAQAADGSLFFSFSLTETVGTGSADDGDLIFLDAANITYDANGNVLSVVPNTAVIAAIDDEFTALINASGMLSSTGGTTSDVTDLSGLEIDPNGGTWTPVSSGLTLPNLLFSWQGFSNDGAIISTAGGGTIASINGVPMASTVATQGDQVGLLPDSTGIFGIEGLALIPQQAHKLAAENFPVDLHTSTDTGASWMRVEWASGPPSGMVFWTVSVGPTTPGGFVASVNQPGGELFVGNLFVPIVALPCDPNGYGSISFVLGPDPNAPGNNIVFHVINLNTFEISTPAPVQFI